MAAGDIIIPGNTITPEIMQKIAAEITKLINTNAKDPGQWEVVTSTNGVTSLPVLQVMGSTYKLVRLAVSTLQGVNGREVELQMNAEKTAIQWRYVAVSRSDLQPTEWRTLIEVSLLKGDPGETPNFRTGEKGIEWKYKTEDEGAWRVLIAYDVLKLKFSDLSADNIAEFWRGVPDDVMAEFQKPAADAAAEVRQEMTQISQDVSQAIRDTNTAKDNANTAAGNANDEAANLEELKKAVTNASYLAEDKADEAEQQAAEAEKQAAEAKKQAAYAKEQGDYAADFNNRVIELEDTKLDGLIVENDLLYGLVNGELYGEGISMPSGGGGGVIGMQYFLRTMNNLESKSLFASKGQPCYINFTFVSQQREGSDQPYTDTGERGYCQIFARAGREPYREVKSMYVESGKEIKLDVSAYLASGDNNIKINIAGEDTAVNAPALTYSVQLTALSLSANNFQWWTPFQSTILIPLNIGGNISKTLHIDVTGTDYNKSYDVEIGTNIYTETSYNYALTHPGKTGVFNVSLFIRNSDGTVRTNTVSFNVICIMSGATEKLIAINNRIEKAVNWSENRVFDYTMYDGGKVSTSARITVMKDDEQIYESDNNAITTAAKQTFTLPLEIETIDNTDFDIVVKVTDAVSEMISTTIPVDNSLGFSANAGAVFYMNPRTRSNSQENRQSVVNEMTGDLISTTWKNFNWGADGWTTDANNSKVLRIMAGSLVDISYKPFATESARIGKTIEIDYKVDNVTDFDKEVLTIASSAAAFVGLKIYPDNVIMYSQSLKNDDEQSFNVRDGERIRLTLTIMPDAYGNSDFNICIIYINGRKNREFTYKNNDYFAHAGNIVIGSDYADIDLYGIRIYDSALTSQAVHRNFINWLSSNSEKVQETDINNILDANGSEVDFENVKKQYNVFVFDNTFPRLSNPNRYKGTLEIFFAGHPELNAFIEAEARGQGTTSMRYWWWNIRFTLSSGSWQMIPGIPAAGRFTAKKNFASSMHSHKMGSVNSYHDLYKALGLSNEAMETEEHADARVAVYQEPFVGFEKTVNEEGVTIYTFMGLYTMGPDKGDKNTFGYNTKLFPGLISIEGSDNAPLAALFRVPWGAKMAYNEDEEAWQYNGVNSWDFAAGDIANINKWIPAYNLVYQCSPRLKPFAGTLDELNAQISTYRNEQYEFWIAKKGDANLYNLYYYEASEGKFVLSDIGDGTINLVSQLADKGYGLTSADITGKTNEELNTLFINVRVAKFRSEAATYFDIDDAIYHRNWVEFHAATDNRAKNTYPYNFGNDGSKWKWRADDLDTIFDIDNQGQAKKGYSVEFHDKYDNGAPVWNGETSNFWNLLDLAFPDEVVAGMRKMMSAMEELSGLNNGDDFDKLFAYFKKYYWSKAQKYFPANLYNADAKFTYETAKLAYIDGRYTNDTDPMTQALGDHYLAEQRWITKRILYMMSKYSFGMFSANGTDNITVRAAGDAIRYELTPAMDLYPAIASGTSIIRGQRTKAGETCEMIIDLAGSGDQQNTIQGASYLQDIGEWHDKNVTGSMIIQGKRLRQIRLGSKTEPITISISSLTISNCVSLQVLSLSRIATLSGSLNLSACTHLKEVYADGTALAQLVLPAGGGLEHIEYSAYNRYINLQNFPLLQSSGVVIDYCKEIITDVLVSGCDKLNPIDTLTEIIDAQKNQAEHALKRIRCIGFDAVCPENTVEILLKLGDGSYVGLDANGVETAGLPVLDGKIHVPSIREDKLDELGELFPELIITYDTLILLPTVTLSFKSSQDKYLLSAKFECSNYYQKIDDTTFKVKGLLNSKFTFTFSALNHVDMIGEVTITQQEETKECSVEYIPLRTLRVLKNNTTITIPNASITIGDKTYTTNTAGQVLIRSKDAVSGSAVATNYNSEVFDFDAIVDDTKNIIYLYPYATITFTVRDEEGNLLSGATVSVDNKKATTNSSGVCNIAVKKGNHNYFVTYDNFSASGSISVAFSNISVSAVVTLNIESMKPVENGNVQMMLQGNANATQLTIDTTSDYIINWGDGQTSNADRIGTNIHTHEYADGMTMYQLEITNCTGITRIELPSNSLVAYWSIGDSKIRNVTFNNCGQLMYFGDVFKNDGNRVTLYSLFKGCRSLKSIDLTPLSGLVNVTDCSSMFDTCTSLQSIDLTPLSNWTNVITVSNLFNLCLALQSIDLTPLSNWTNVTNTYSMLAQCGKVQSIDLTPLGNWTSVTYARNLLYGCDGLQSIDLTPLSNWTSVTDCSGMFDSCRSLKSIDLTPLSNWTNVTNVSSLLLSCRSLKSIDLTPLSGLVNVTDCSAMFGRCDNLQSIDLTLLSNWVNVTDCSAMFMECISLQSIDLTPLSNWVKCGNLNQFFQNCNKLQSVDLTPLRNWTNTLRLDSMFMKCTSLQSIDLTPLSGWTKVTIVYSMFDTCTSLQSIDLTPLSNWTNVNSIAGILYRCTAIKYILINNSIPFVITTNTIVDNGCPIYVPDESIEAYKTATNWSTYADRIKPLSDFATDFPEEVLE